MSGKRPGGGSYLLNRWAALYTKPTDAENAIEPYIAALGRRYRAQHPVFQTGFFLDFALLDEKIGIEVDGKSHVGAEAEEKDRLRTIKLQKYGWVIVRCTNAEAQWDPQKALNRMLKEAAAQRNALNLLTGK